MEQNELDADGASSRWDLCAVALSSVCLAHCLVLPLLATALPLVSHFSESHTVHVVLVLMAAPVTLWIVWGVLKRGGGRVFSFFALIGLTFLLVAVLIPFLEQFEVQLTLVGVLLLGGAHLWRWNHHRVPSRRAA